MPLVHQQSYQVRFYECDAFGHLNNINYVLFMQEAAFKASAAAGYDLAHYNRTEHYWLVRATDIEYLQPVQYGDTVTVSTWVSDFRRISSRRMYEIVSENSGDTVARGFSDWVYINRTSGRPASVPSEMQKAFFPEGVPDRFPARKPFPTAPSPPPGIFRMKQKVKFQDIDTAQHVNNARYLAYVEECGMQVIAAHNWPVVRMIEEGFAIFLRRHQIQYLQPALLDEELEISTWASHVRRSTAQRHYLISRLPDHELLARVHSTGVWVDLSSGKPIRIPDALLRDFQANISSG